MPRPRHQAGRPPRVRNETPPERDDRNFVELLQELRVTQNGVQILFAFLLTLAFTERFRDLDDIQRATYVTTLVLAMTATVLFTSPAALHRMLFRRGMKRQVVEVSSRLATVGLGVLALALAGALLLVVDVVLGRAAGIGISVGAFGLCAALWGLLPRVLRKRGWPVRYGATSAPSRSPRPARKQADSPYGAA
ncbi:DUF6328 family protein [Streptomyces sp. DSM 44917]|uniref:DUF6328 family protein n=1 Tax=Streptomyces boetiae TaxID=3075541 RepID=A0ABU2LEL7_9ACTN|nr:DUF6328 family protein [Streptomyces sp. DSM 44917]MDT0309703.1 DUF6328 family protein [Streptomyces sp. DSM 44917]